MTLSRDEIIDRYLAGAIRKLDEGARFCLAPISTCFCFDYSWSMAENDILPCRFMAAVLAIEAFIKKRKQAGLSDLVSAVVFAQSARVVSGLVSIAEAERRLLAPLCGESPAGGTNISAGLSKAGECLNESPSGYTRSIVLLSDGEDGGSPYDVAERIKAAGVIINCIGVGRRPQDIDEACLKRVCSEVDGVLRYRFITDAETLSRHFESLATGIARTS